MAAAVAVLAAAAVTVLAAAVPALLGVCVGVGVFVGVFVGSGQTTSPNSFHSQSSSPWCLGPTCPTIAVPATANATKTTMEVAPAEWRAKNCIVRDMVLIVLLWAWPYL